MDFFLAHTTGWLTGALITMFLLWVYTFFLWKKSETLQKQHRKVLLFSHQRELASNIQSIIQDLAQFCKEHPKLAHPYMILGNLYRMSGEPQRSLPIHQNLLTDESIPRPLRDRLTIELAADFTELGLEEQALQTLKEVHERSAFYTPAQEKLVDLYYQRELYLEAHQAMTQILDRQKNWRNRKRTAYLLALHADQLFNQGNLPEAKKVIQKVLHFDPECVLALYLQGLIALEEHAFDTAIESLSTIMQLNPSYGFLAIPRLEDAYYGKQSFMRFGEKLQALYQASSTNMFTLFSLGKYFRKRKLYADARKTLTRALELNPTFIMAREEMLAINREEGKAQESLNDYQNFLDEIASHKLFICKNCQTRYPKMMWHCSSCGRWESVHADLTLYPGMMEDEEAPVQFQASHS